MKAQYKNNVALKHDIAIPKITLSSILALDGLTERSHVDYLQTVVNEVWSAPLGLKALDLGSGRGVSAMALAEMGFQVVAYDMNRASIAVVQQLAMKQDLNISFDVDGTSSLEQLQEKFDLIHDVDCLTNMPMTEDRVRFLEGVKNTLAEDGTFVLSTAVQSVNFDPTESFESLHLDANHILWRQTPECDVPGVTAIDGRYWTAQKKVAPAAIIREELMAAGFEILSEELEICSGNQPAILKLVVCKG